MSQLWGRRVLYRFPISGEVSGSENILNISLGKERNNIESIRLIYLHPTQLAQPFGYQPYQVWSATDQLNAHTPSRTHSLTHAKCSFIQIPNSSLTCTCSVNNALYNGHFVALTNRSYRHLSLNCCLVFVT